MKRQSVYLWGNTHDLLIVAKAYHGKEISQPQRDSYLQFIDNLPTVSERSHKMLDDYLSTYNKTHIDNELETSVTPRCVLFKQDGSYGILCDFSLDPEHGLVIVLTPKKEVGMQDIFL